MTPAPARRTRGPRSRAISTIATLLLAVSTVAAVGGCDLRLDGPAPTAPSPGAVEQVRERAVADALDLARDAPAAAAAAGADVAAVLAQVADFSTEHAEQLGGPYVSGLPTPSGSPGTSATAPPVASVQDVLDKLSSTATTALADAATTSDGGLARLLASIGTARDELATRLASAAGLVATGPTVAPTAEATTGPVPSPTPSLDPSASADVRALVLAHDQAGFGFEAIAAAAGGNERKAAVAAASTHRARAVELAERAGIDGSADDPRRAAYTLPASLADAAARAALAQSLEDAVAAAAASTVAHVDATAREPWIAELRTATAAARTWGAPAAAFPGMPELASPPAG